MQGLLSEFVVQRPSVRRFSQVLSTHPALLELTVHVFKYEEQAVSSL
jgi:hypothetical protein